MPVKVHIDQLTTGPCHIIQKFVCIDQLPLKFDLRVELYIVLGDVVDQVEHIEQNSPVIVQIRCVVHLKDVLHNAITAVFEVHRKAHLFLHLVEGVVDDFGESGLYRLLSVFQLGIILSLIPVV